ncbi:MAG: hypothetical protein JXA19_00315 [Anaerolineales bacterium]|nr:hypothetical protein [Anaerolineales bacterium]
MTEKKRMEILEKIESGEITPEEGIALLDDTPEINENLSPMEILTRIESGSISPEEGARLLENSRKSENRFNPLPTMRLPEMDSGNRIIHKVSINADNSGFVDRDNEDQVEEVMTGKIPDVSKWQNIWTIPLWIGLTFVIASGYGINRFIAAGNFGVWFYLTFLPFLLGGGLILLGLASRTSVWLHVRIQDKDEDGKFKNINISLPIPIRPAVWFLKNFGDQIKELDQVIVETILNSLENQSYKRDPIQIFVEDEEDDGRVEVFIG